MDVFELNGKVELIIDDHMIIEGIIHDFSDDKLYVSFISDEKQFKLLYVDDIVNCVVFKGNHCHSFDATITNRIKGDFPTYELSDLRNFIKIQRRQDVRVPYTDSIRFSINPYLLDLSMNEMQKQISSINKYFMSGRILDLSAGGIKFSSNKNLNKNQIIIFQLRIDKDTVLLKGRILHKSISVSPKDTIYTYGAEFLDISEVLREKIIKYLFIIMRKNRIKKR